MTGFTMTNTFKTREEYINELNIAGRMIFNAADNSQHDAIRAICASPHDVIIVGGGPAGLYAAAELSQKGIKVLLCERGLIFDSVKTFAVLDNMVTRYNLEEAVSRHNEIAWFRSYLGLDHPAKIGYCVIDQTALLYVLAKRIRRDFCEIIENCEVTAYQRLSPDCLKVKTVVNDFRLIPYLEAREQAPRATYLAQTDTFFYEKNNPLVLVNFMDELDNNAKMYDNFNFKAPLLVDAGGFRSNLVKSFHKQRLTNVWKCIVYEFEGLEKEPKDIIWDMAVPTATSANFWVDVFGTGKAAVGVMVLTRTTAENPDAIPSKADMGTYMSTWLNIRKISGRITRERYGFIPMTDFRETAAFDNIIFIGASATRQIPNVGYGIVPAFEEAALCAGTIVRALEKKRFDVKMLRGYEIAWLKKFEYGMALQKVFQDLHYAYETDEYFNELGEKSMNISDDYIRRGICNELTINDLLKLSGVFARNSQLLDRHRLDPSLFGELLDDCGRMLYCMISAMLHCYCPWGNTMFRNEPLNRPWPLSWLWGLYVFAVRTVPERFLRECSRILFSRTFQGCSRFFSPR